MNPVRAAGWFSGLLAIVLAAAACTATPPPDPPASSPVSTPSTSPDPDDDGFTFEDAAEFEGGLTIEVSGVPLARRAGEHEKGAEGTGGEIVVIAVLITNEGTESFPAQEALITLQYAGVDDAPLIVDETGDLQAGFSEPIPPGGDATATLGFAVPFSALQDISITVDPGTDIDEPVTFSGAAEREDEGG